jgi:methylenetetrahydrofolate dehydrogenase (NADP+) / methenyltetrahydrofolate cyclohydrolase
VKIDPSFVAKEFRSQIRSVIQGENLKLKLVGFLASDDEASEVYSEYTKIGCQDVGVEYEVRRISRVSLESEIRAVNTEKGVTGVIVYYPIFGGARDAHLRSVLSPLKDIEGLHPFWLDKLYSNTRTIEEYSTENSLAKPLLPCTPLAVFKLLEAAGEMHAPPQKPFTGKTVSIFNRSEVVGRPLAFMMANDGAQVFSFDINGVMTFSKEDGELESTISRKEALRLSDIVITGVPSKNFELIRSDEMKPDACCLNFSSFKNFSDDVVDSARIFVPRVGPVTVAMCLRNVLRLYQQYHSKFISA